MGQDEKKHPEPKVRTVNQDSSAQGDKVEEIMSSEAHGREKTTNNFCVCHREKIRGRKMGRGWGEGGGYNQFCNLGPNNRMWL